MIINRTYFKPIKKRDIPLKNLIAYEDIDIDDINTLLNRVISDNIYDTFDLLRLVKDNYQGNMDDAIRNIKDYSSVRFNCYHACKILKYELKELGIRSYIIGYKSIGFSNTYGDELIKEAHMALAIPTIKDNRVLYILLDPGLRIPRVLEFYKDDINTKILIDNDTITIKKTSDEFYNYTMIMEGFNRYSTSNTSYKCQEYFDLSHEIINPEDILFPASIYVLNGYRIIRFSTDKNYQCSIKLLLDEEYFEISSNKIHEIIIFKRFKDMSEDEFIKMLIPIQSILDVDLKEFYSLLFFIIDKKNEINNIRYIGAYL